MAWAQIFGGDQRGQIELHAAAGLARKQQLSGNLQTELVRQVIPLCNSTAAKVQLKKLMDVIHADSVTRVTSAIGRRVLQRLESGFGEFIIGGAQWKALMGILWVIKHKDVVVFIERAWNIRTASLHNPAVRICEFVHDPRRARRVHQGCRHTSERHLPVFQETALAIVLQPAG